MDCPVCKTERLTMSERQGIEIDYCPKCRGIWLDRGELDKLIERATQELAAATQAGPATAPAARATVPAPGCSPAGQHGGHHDEHRYRGHHRKSLWKELFD